MRIMETGLAAVQTGFCENSEPEIFTRSCLPRAGGIGDNRANGRGRNLLREFISQPSRLGRHGLNFVRWFAAEFLRIPMRLGTVSVLTGACRLIGCAVIGSLMYFQLQEAGASTFTYVALAEWPLAALISLLIGNLAKEMAFTVCERIAASLGRDFDRRGYMLDGRKFRETTHVDGTWIRCESGPRGTVCEWTDAYGHCSKVVTGPVRRNKERQR